MSTNMDDDLLADSIVRMGKRLEQPPIPEVTSEQWLERCRFLLGTSDGGELLPLAD